jgi:hypothetical protein
MPFQPVPNTIRVQLGGVNDALVWENVMHWAFSGAAPSTTLLDQAALKFFDAFAQHLMPLAPEAVTLQAAVLTDLSSQTGAQGSYAAIAPGSAPGPNLGAQVAAVISKETSYRYRGGHGRSYLPVGTGSDLETSGTWNPNFTQNLVDAWVAFVNEVSNGNAFVGIGNEVIVHRVVNKVPIPQAFVSAITGYLAQQVLGTQRRRLYN